MTRAWKRLCIAGLCLALAGCAARAVIVVLPEADGIGATETVFVASTRQFVDGAFTDTRLEGLDFTRFAVHVPPRRDLGAIEAAGARPDPETQFLVTRADSLADARGYRAALSAALAARPADAREVMLFVHGFNSTFADGLYRTAQIRHDFGVPGVAVHYAWPSAGHPLGYAYDRDSALFARDGLERLIAETAAAGSHDIVLVAHSLGSAVTMEALRQLRIGGRQDVLDRIAGVILFSPDIDTEVFRVQAARIAPLPQPFVIFTSRRDRALRISALITGQRERLGSLGEIDDVAEFDITMIDVTSFRGGADDGLNHFTAASSPGMVRLLQQVAQVNLAFERDAGQQLGLLPGTILTVRNATRVILEADLP